MEHEIETLDGEREDRTGLLVGDFISLYTSGLIRIHGRMDMIQSSWVILPQHLAACPLYLILRVLLSSFSVMFSICLLSPVSLLFSSSLGRRVWNVTGIHGVGS